MKPSHIINKAKSHGIELDINLEGRLVVDAPAGTMTNERMGFILEHKQSIIDEIAGGLAAGQILKVYKQVSFEDGRFVLEKLQGIDSLQRYQLSVQWHQEFNAGYDDEPVPYKKTNAGRFRANTWLRKFIDGELL